MHVADGWCPNDWYRHEHDATAPADDALALERQVCFALSVAARNVVAVYRPFLEPMGLTHPQYLVMLALWQHGSLSVKDLSGLLQLDPGTLSPLVKRLEVPGSCAATATRGTNARWPSRSPSRGGHFAAGRTHPAGHRRPPGHGR